MKVQTVPRYEVGSTVMYVDQSSLYEPKWKVLSISAVNQTYESEEVVFRYKCEAKVDGKTVRKGFNEDLLIKGIAPRFNPRFILAILMRMIYLFLYDKHEKFGNWLENGKFTHALDNVSRPYPHDLFGHIKADRVGTQ